MIFSYPGNGIAAGRLLLLFFENFFGFGFRIRKYQRANRDPTRMSVFVVPAATFAACPILE
jgi:hypothetical protein